MRVHLRKTLARLILLGVGACSPPILVEIPENLRPADLVGDWTVDYWGPPSGDVSAREELSLAANGSFRQEFVLGYQEFILGYYRYEGTGTWSLVGEADGRPALLLYGFRNYYHVTLDAEAAIASAETDMRNPERLYIRGSRSIGLCRGDPDSPFCFRKSDE